MPGAEVSGRNVRAAPFGMAPKRLWSISNPALAGRLRDQDLGIRKLGFALGQFPQLTLAAFNKILSITSHPWIGRAEARPCLPMANAFSR